MNWGVFSRFCPQLPFRPLFVRPVSTIGRKETGVYPQHLILFHRVLWISVGPETGQFSKIVRIADFTFSEAIVFIMPGWVFHNLFKCFKPLFLPPAAGRFVVLLYILLPINFFYVCHSKNS